MRLNCSPKSEDAIRLAATLSKERVLTGIAFARKKNPIRAFIHAVAENFIGRLAGTTVVRLLIEFREFADRGAEAAGSEIGWWMCSRSEATDCQVRS